ncbi:LexA-binding, inner membrane-associated putative hydrolase [Fervidobacterium changbaicum]|uniref:Metal-dependent hydrolase n=2 Tax=Fervidobacterium TaxID=2422 RepID=A0AAI8CLY5_FERIS|nr:MULTISPECIES: metal-dependent hydrolase [Fervidobacterium]AMW33376.1 metal-dependent hydrolase [Fervidobacterium islandicum]QAV33411.1 metal-dependent hydrolase [Fervidobacterium changbaicum]SDG91629.1 LexA-binding, inner membrane-associated putative hydrolase [Fervidobacterium changbaicum]
MPNLVAHLRIGMISYPIFLLIYGIVAKLLGYEFSPAPVEIAISYAVFILGSDLPDLDSSNAPLRNFTKSISLAFAIYVFTAFIYDKLGAIEQLSVVPKEIVLAFSVAISMLIGLGLINLFLSLPIFSHRGFAHSVTFAAIYGFLVYLFASPKSSSAIFFGISAFSGVMVHMIADYIGNPAKIFKLY